MAKPKIHRHTCSRCPHPKRAECNFFRAGAEFMEYKGALGIFRKAPSLWPDV